MSDEQYDKRMSKAKGIAKNRRRKQKIREARNQWKPKKPHKKFEFSKIIVFLVFIMCMEILIFSQCLLWNTQDTSALYSLIAIPSTLVPTLILYYTKAKSENIVKLNNLFDNSIFQNIQEQDDTTNTTEQQDNNSASGGVG